MFLRLGRAVAASWLKSGSASPWPGGSGGSSPLRWKPWLYKVFLIRIYLCVPIPRFLKQKDFFKKRIQVGERMSAQSKNQSMLRKQDNMPKRNKKNFRSTKSGAGMTRAGVAAYRRKNPGSKLKTAVTGKVKKGSAAAKRRKSYCARSAGQMKKFPKAAANPNSRLRQARRRWKC